MKVLVTGATGFVGSWLVKKLIETGFSVVCAVKNTALAKIEFPQAEVIPCNFTRDREISHWVPRLQGIDVVINCVGLFYHKNKEMLWDVHYRTPIALFKAAEEAGVKRIIHISALGIENYNTAYAQSKKAAEDYLINQVKAPYFIVKPSFIYGPGSRGGMTLLKSLAAFPGLIPLPGKGKQQFQPIFIKDLVDAIISLVSVRSTISSSFAFVSDKPISIKEIVFTLSNWLGFRKKSFLPIPPFLLDWGAALGSLFSSPLLNKEAIEMMNKGNKATKNQVLAFQEQTGVKPKTFKEGINYFPSTEADKWQAKLFFLHPLLRFSLAFMWIMAAMTSAFFFKDNSYQLLTAVGVPTTYQAVTLYSAVLLNLIIGLTLFLGLKIKLNCLIQIAVIVLYTLIITVFIPFYWLEPFGPVVKNIPILVSILILYSLEP